MMNISLNLLSKYRSELMGGGTLLILICHAYGNNVKMPYLLERIVDNAQIGVDLFLLLSGIGIAFSLEKTVIGYGNLSLISWYWQRIKRIYVPFGIIMTLFYLYAILFEGKPVSQAILDLTNIGWWINGKGTWYVSLILLLYLVAPILYKILYEGKHKWLILAILSLGVWIIFQDDPNSVFHYVANAIKRSPAFFIGIAITPLVKIGFKVNLPLLLLLSTILFLVGTIALPFGFCKWMMILPIALVIALFIDKVHSLRAPFAFLGIISLESYLTNITLGDILNHKSWIICGYDLSYGHYLEYAVVVVVGVYLAWVFNNVSNRILKTKISNGGKGS